MVPGLWNVVGKFLPMLSLPLEGFMNAQAWRGLGQGLVLSVLL